MTVFLAPDITTDPLVLQAEAKQFLEEELPGWHSSPGSIVDLVIEAHSHPAAEQNEALKAELVAAYRSLGSLIGVQPIRARPATALVTFVVADTAGHVLTAANTVVGLHTSSNELRSFRLVADLTIAPELSSGVGLAEDTEPGEAGNNLAGTCELIEADASIISATAGTSGGGVNEEEEGVFLDRLTEELAIQKPGPVRAEDAAVIARQIGGVYRATGVDLLKPAVADGGEGAESTTEEKCVTVAAVGVNGAPVSAGISTQILELLNSLREINFKFFVVKPHYTKIDVTATVFAWPGANLAVVKEEVVAALKAFLSPARWATNVSGNPESWKNDPIVRQSELFTAVSNVRGVRWCSVLNFGAHGDALGTANVTLGAGSAVPALPDVDGTADGSGVKATFNITVEGST
jgi:hypothetical protein